MAFFSFENISIEALASAVPLSSGKGTSIRKSKEEQTAGDLGFEAAKKIFDEKNIDKEKVGIIVFISRTPDYRSPATAMVLHNRLGLSKDCIAFDNNLGNAGFLYGMQIVGSLLQGINKPLGLLVLGDTISKQLPDGDILSMGYGDSGSAVLLERKESAAPIFVETYADGTELKSFILVEGGFRKPGVSSISELIIDKDRMSNYGAQVIPDAVKHFLKKTALTRNDFDLQVFPFADKKIIQQLEPVCGALTDNVTDFLSKFGDNSASSIPMYFCSKADLKNERYRVLAGCFGEGLSWGVASFEINRMAVIPAIETDNAFDNGFVTHEM